MGKVLFTSRRPLGRCENLTAVYNAYEGEKIFVQENWVKEKYNPRIYGKDITCMVADDFVPYSPGKLIMITHGASGGKKYGLTQPHGYFTRKDSAMIDWVVSTSKDMIDVEAAQFGVPREKVLPLGMPRFDFYVGKKKGDGGTIYGQMSDKKIYLYVPTHRNPYEPRFPGVNFNGINMELEDDEIFLVKRHMVMPRPFLGSHGYKRIKEISNNENSAPYLIDADVVVTDYSSILFDAHALKKPLILFELRDGLTDDYLEKRGMTDVYPEGYSSRFATREMQLIHMMRDAVGGSQGPEDIQCWERHCGACDGHSTERVVDLIWRTNG